MQSTPVTVFSLMPRSGFCGRATLGHLWPLAVFTWGSVSRSSPQRGLEKWPGSGNPNCKRLMTRAGLHGSSLLPARKANVFVLCRCQSPARDIVLAASRRHVGRHPVSVATTGIDAVELHKRLHLR